MGSSHAEQNHWSVVSFLGTLFESPAEEIRHLLNRNQRLFKLTDDRLAQRHMSLQGERSMLGDKPLSESLKAKMALREVGFELWEEQFLLFAFHKKERLPDGS